MNKTDQRSPEWFENRRSHIGGSDISIINGTNPWKSPYTLWLEKTGKKGPDKTTPAMQRGIDMEPVALAKYIELHGIPLIPRVMYSKEWEVAMASLDGITENAGVICEIKCPTSFRLYENALELKIPDYYHDQMQWQLWVTKADRCDYFVYVDDSEHTMIPVYPDVKYQLSMVKKAKEFWEYVVKDTPPDTTDRDEEYISDAMSNGLAEKWAELKANEQSIVQERKDIETKLKSLHGGKKCFFTHANIKMKRFSRKGTIDWVKFCNDYDITEDILAKYRKEGIPCVTFSNKQ